MSRALLALFLACFATAAIAQESLDTVENKIRDAWSKHNSITADFTMDAIIPVGANRLPVSGKGDVKYLKEKDIEKFRQRVSVKLPEPLKLEAKLDILYDGKDLYMTNEAMGKQETSKEHPDLTKGAVPPGGALLLSVISDSLNLSVRPDTEIDGKPVYVIEGRPKAKSKELPFMKAMFYIDKEIGIQRKTQLFESEDSATATMLYSDVKLDPVIPASEFVYVPPAETPAAPAAAAPTAGGSAPAAPAAGAGGGPAPGAPSPVPGPPPLVSPGR